MPKTAPYMPAKPPPPKKVTNSERSEPIRWQMDPAKKDAYLLLTAADFGPVDGLHNSA